MLRFIVLALHLFTAPSLAEEFTARVVGITDGDTIRVLRDKDEIKIRLTEIDCPESRQAFGTKAKQATSDLAFGKIVTVRAKGKDRNGRPLAEITLPDGKSLNRELVRLGFAWWFKKYSKDESLGKLEEEARSAKKGLWADESPVPPWEWREREKEKAKEKKAAADFMHVADPPTRNLPFLCVRTKIRSGPCSD